MKPVVRVPSDALLAYFYQDELDPHNSLSSEEWNSFLDEQELNYVKLCKGIAKTLLKIHLTSGNS